MKRRASFCFKTCVWKYKSKKYYCWHSFTVATHLPWLFAVKICRGYLPQLFAVAICRGNLTWLFAVGICHGYLQWLFAVGICRSYLPWEFAVAICRENLLGLFAVGFFVYVSKSFLVCVSKSCLYGSKPFLDMSKSFLFVKCSLLMVFLFLIVVAVMGHRTLAHNICQHLSNQAEPFKFDLTTCRYLQ